MFEDWLIEYEEVKTIWSRGWALGQDGTEVATRNHRTEAIDASALQESMVSIDFGASELGVATARLRKLAVEFCEKQDGGEQGRRFVEGCGEEERVSEMERGVMCLKSGWSNWKK